MTVRVSRIIRAPLQQVFDAWLKPEIMKQWWLNGDGEPMTHCEIDARVGGRYVWKQFGACEIEGVKYTGDYEWVMQGKFLEIIPPRRIVFTWNVNHQPPTVDEKVTVEFHECDGGTEIVITHEGIHSTAMRDGTDDGWSQLMDNLAATIENR
jgi:uncharacterized protein YndB with AHSA1/START domain